MLIPLSNAPRDYDWGSTTLLAALEGREPSDAPEAEVWLGDHPGDPAIVGDGTGRSLDAWLAAEAPALGVPDRLPYLLKLLAAGSNLSIQAHPSKPQAEEGFAREDAAGIPRDAAERNYRDDNHKPELLVALSPEFEALSGIRDAHATRRLLDTLGDARGAVELTLRLGDGDAAAVRSVIGWLLSGDAGAEVASIVAAIDRVDGTVPAAEFAGEFAAARRIAARFPGDPGVAVALLMNRVVLRRGEALYLDAGQPHAYLAGLGVELMAASDNVLRGGLTGKHIDVDELLAVLDTVASDVRLLPAGRVAGSQGDVTAFAPGIPDFELLRAVVTADRPARVPVRGTAIVVATAGAVRVEGGSASHDLSPGRALLATPDESPLRLSGAGEVFVAQPGE